MAFHLVLRGILGVVVMCACKSLGSCLHTIVNVWLGREKYVLKIESNSFSGVRVGTLVQLLNQWSCHCWNIKLVCADM